MDNEVGVDRIARWLVLKEDARKLLAPLFPSVTQTQGPLLVIEYADTLQEGSFGVTVSARVNVLDTRTNSMSQKDVRLTVPWTLVEYYLDIIVPEGMSAIGKSGVGIGIGSLTATSIINVELCEHDGDSSVEGYGRLRVATISLTICSGDFGAGVRK